ncbi:hypothetical protein [Psychroserpens algicola]|uniref:DUF4168 domain-containing protein n=1 Tax=Psychroserpens algicola TaxID=1719034 RepID=A0ABT0H8V3_9FLAO|nr:hypothetical protein [Psychroserpens algicola]MCK8480799.1 hypothetical protein [Psychroserpens algicola]
MKKLITLCLFSVALLFNTQSITAQNTLEINAQANIKTKELRKIVKFEDSKKQDVYKAYQDYGIAYKKISSNLTENTERFEKINTALDERLKNILTEEEYVLYLKYFRDR